MKRFFKIEILGDQRKFRDNVLIEDEPKGLGLKSYYPSKGIPLSEYYPSQAVINVREENPGRQLTSFLSNTVNLLYFDNQIKRVIEDVCSAQDIEYLPFILYDHVRCILSKDYWLISPIGTYDCVNRLASNIAYLDEDPEKEILSVETFVFREEAVASAPHLFRVPEQPYNYFIDETLGKAINATNPTNIFLTEIEL